MHALVTGASGAIGSAIARRLAADGFALTLAGRRVQPMQALAAELGDARVVRCDLAEDGAPRALLDAIAPVDVLVNNAGMQYVEPVQGVSDERIERLFRVNLTAPLQLMNQAVEQMLPRGRGAVVNIASMAAVSPMPGSAHYSSSKAALASASETSRVELAGTGVHVLTVYPGPVRSDMQAAAVDAMDDSLAARLVHTGDPEVLARRIVRAMNARSARVIYPRTYLPGFYLPRVASAVMERLTPPVRAQ